MPRIAEDETFWYKGYKVVIEVQGLDYNKYKIFTKSGAEISKGNRRGKVKTKNHCKEVINDYINSN